MNITMIQTVEDSHGYSVENPDTGALTIEFDVRKFYEGQTYTPENGGPDFDRRATMLVRMGYATEVVDAGA